ncbi:HNH endonuclease [Desulfobacter sp.]
MVHFRTLAASLILLSHKASKPQRITKSKALIKTLLTTLYGNNEKSKLTSVVTGIKKQLKIRYDRYNEEELFTEGIKKTIIINRYERDVHARLLCIEHYESYCCQICGFDFQKIYGELGRNYIHVHHLTPLSEIGKEYTVNPKTDLIPVCPNCHAMLHKRANPSDIDALKKIINNQTF